MKTTFKIIVLIIVSMGVVLTVYSFVSKDTITNSAEVLKEKIDDTFNVSAQKVDTVSGMSQPQYETGNTIQRTDYQKKNNVQTGLLAQNGVGIAPGTAGNASTAMGNRTGADQNSGRLTVAQSKEIQQHITVAQDNYETVVKMLKNGISR